ncbi:MAG: hypothetical protein KAR07_08745 [Spirochaetes bacterium]|nr:hypothetical protein [Spirochaetota bacterium]
MSIGKSINIILNEIKKLHENYPQKKFTMDGRLVGDLGEVLAEQNYKIKLYDGQHSRHDACFENNKKREVQIKTTMKENLGFPHDEQKWPEYYLGIRLIDDGSIVEIFNGPGNIIADEMKNRKRPGNGLHVISINRLKKLNEKVKKRIPRRK